MMTRFINSFYDLRKAVADLAAAGTEDNTPVVLHADTDVEYYVPKPSDSNPDHEELVTDHITVDEPVTQIALTSTGGARQVELR